VKITFGFILFVIGVLIVAGCGGNGVTASPAGTLKLSVKWPVRTRLIPVDSNSIVAVLTDANGKSLGQQTLARPTSGNSTTVSFTSLQPGAVTLTASAFPTANGTGVAQATGAAPATIVAGQTAQVTVTMLDTIVKVTISPASPSVSVNSTATLTMTAYNSQGDVVLTSPTTTQWKSGSTNFATISSGGVLTGVGQGTSLITVTETESGVSGTTTATVNPALSFNPVNVVVDHTGKYAYSIDQFGYIFEFSIGANGDLTPLPYGPVKTGLLADGFEGFGGGQNTLVSSGNYLYFVGEPSQIDVAPELLEYQIQSDGNLVALSPASLSLPAGDYLATMLFDPSWKYLYVQMETNGPNTLRTYLIGSNGVLSKAAPDVTTGPIITAAAAIPKTNYLVTTQNDELVTEQVGANGVLTPVFSDTTDFVEDTVLQMDPLGRFFYVLSRNTNLIQPFDVGANGTFTNPNITVPGTGSWTQSTFAMTSNGNFLVARTGSASGVIQSFSVASNGGLTQISSLSPVGETNSYNEIALTPNNQFVYDPSDTDLAQFSLSSSGVLTPLNPSTVN